MWRPFLFPRPPLFTVKSGGSAIDNHNLCFEFLDVFWRGEFKNTALLFMQKAIVCREQKNNRQKANARVFLDFLVLSRFWGAFLGGESPKTPHCTFYQSSKSDLLCK
jgi:hypothetical protein